MSHRVKRPNRTEDGSVPVKRRKRTTAEEEEAEAAAAVTASNAVNAWQPPRPNDLKTIYNRTTSEAPAELFRKDLISAMKLPDSEPLAHDEYWVIVDQWKQEWERGVQVPVNPDSLPEPTVSVNKCPGYRPKHEFKLPKTTYIRITKDENFKPEEHTLSHAPAHSEAACSYDLDECDMAWLKILNGERAASGLSPVYEDQLERVLERLELCCWDKIQSILRNEEGLGIEYDENVICDVCRSPDSEEGNEMVFCDSCNICVHQACYGITRIPEGQWLCCTCNIGKRPECMLCPNKGGAMKATRTGQKWAHVSCALWIPEVSIGCVEKMEPITKISSIPASRWALICVLCRERVGACIQCSVKTCKTAYHVTCAFKHGLEMRAIIEDENADDGVKLRSYCEKHSKSSKKETKSICSGSEDDNNIADGCSKRIKKRKDMTSEEKNQARAQRLQEIEAEFFKHVQIKDVVSIHHLDVDNEAMQYIYNYWKLKRKSGHNKPLLPPKSDDVDVLSHKREQADLEKMKMFVQLRQDLERVRNLCYMVSRREKLSRTFFRMREQTFHKQAAVLNTTSSSAASQSSLPTTVVEAVIEANHGPSIYDRLYSHNEAEDHTSDFDTILARIAGCKSPKYSGDESKPDINGLFKNNPYKKVYFNGSSKRRSMYDSSMSSGVASSCDEQPEKPKENKENRLAASSEEEEKPSPISLSKKKAKLNNATTTASSNKIATDKRRQKKLHSISQQHHKLNDSSSEEDIIKPVKKEWKLSSQSRLSQMEKELGDSCSDSDELMPMIRNSTNQKTTHQNTAIKSTMSSIYSDSDDDTDASMKNDDDDDGDDKSSHQNKLRTKAAVKDFTHKPSAVTAAAATTTKSPNNKTSSAGNKKKLKDSVDNNKKESTTSKKKDYVPSDLIVPQRQAAKKATENLKSSNTTSSRLKDHGATSNATPVSAATNEDTKVEEKIKVKVKAKTSLREKESPKEDDKIKERDVKTKEARTLEKKKELKQSSTALEQVNDIDIAKEVDKLETEVFAYVPQREAAKKAAEHIKSGLGKPTAAAAPAAEPSAAEVDKSSSSSSKKESDAKTNKKEIIDTKRTETTKKEPEIKPAKITERKNKSSTNSTSTSSSSSSSSSDSSTSSQSSDSEEEPATKKPTLQLLPSKSEKNSSPRREADKRSTAKDWPFLDKGPRPAASSGSSSSSESSDEPSSSSPSRKPSPKPSKTSSNLSPSLAATESTPQSSPTKSNNRKGPQPPAAQAASDKKQQQSSAAASIPKREEQPPARAARGGRGGATRRASRGRPRSSKSGDRLGDADVRPRDMSDGQRVNVEATADNKDRKERSSAAARAELDDQCKEENSKESDNNQLQSPIRKTDKKLKQNNKEPLAAETSYLEKEILERKAGKEGSKSKSSTFDRLFGTSEKNKEDRFDRNKKDLNKSEEKPSLHKSSILAPGKLTVPSVKDSKFDKEKTENSAADTRKKSISTTDKQVKSPEKPSKSPDKLSTTKSTTINIDNDDDKNNTFDTSQKFKDDTSLATPAMDEVVVKSHSTKTTLECDRKLDSKDSNTSSEKKQNRKLMSKNKSIDDILASKLANSESKENKVESKDAMLLKYPKPTADEITIADKIVNDHLQSQKANDFYNRQQNDHVAEVLMNSTTEAALAKTLLMNEFDMDGKKNLKASGVTNQVLQNRPVYSPQPNVKDLLDLSFDEIGLKDDDVMKNNPLTWHFNSASISMKEDNKEDNARETQNLISKLRKGLSKKSGCETDEGIRNDENDTSTGFSEHDIPDNASDHNMDQHVVVNTSLDMQQVKMNAIAEPSFESEQQQIPSQHATTDDYSYLNCDNIEAAATEASRNVPVHHQQQQQPNQGLTDHITPIEGDERWVPPSSSGNNFSNVPQVDDPTTAYLNSSVVTPMDDTAYLEQYANAPAQHPHHHPEQQHHHSNHIVVESNSQPAQMSTINKLPEETLNSLPSQLDVRLQDDHLLKTHSPSLLHDKIDRRISQTPLIDPTSMDCMNSPMPYANIHPQAKWADCEVIPKCRSSSSSAASTSSSSSRREDEELLRPPQDTVRTVNHSTLDMATYLPPVSQVPPFQPNPIDNFGAGYSDGSLYPVSLFPAPNLNNTQMPYPNSGPGTMFPPAAFGAPFPTPSSQQGLQQPSMPPRPIESTSMLPFTSTCTAAFTSSQHNMALTAAMVIPQTSTTPTKSVEQQLEEQLLTAQQQQSQLPPLTPTTITTLSDEQVTAPSPAMSSNTTPTASSTLPSPSTSLKSNSSAGKKSPSKPTRTSARVTSQLMNKSPAKSPGKSPRQEVALKQSGPGRGRGESKRGTKTGFRGATGGGASASRGRGRGRGRGKSTHYNNDYDFVVGSGASSSIHNKLVGTVYDLDFDDDISNDNMTDLKAMRERRKSIDVHDRKFDAYSSTASIRDSPRSPKFHSPSAQTTPSSHKTRNYNADLRELRPPTPLEDNNKSKTDNNLSSMSNTNPSPSQMYPVTPVLPGPVDMRTYNSNTTTSSSTSNFDQQTYNEQNLLSAFATGTTETQVQDIDEDFEKELHTALSTKKLVVEPAPTEIANNIKVSLSDSRNQLKVKIKGPIANYTSTVTPLPPPNIDPIVVSHVNTVSSNAINSAVSSGGGGGGTSNLRRMRKKELLRNYLTQDMNMDDGTSNSGYTAAPAAPLVNRTIITIPKAVASMTSIPTKEDYSYYRMDTDDFIDTKHHRKESKARPGGLSRELRQLDLAADNDGHLERRRSVGSVGSNNSNMSSSFDVSANASNVTNKRRGRPPRQSSSQPVTPKLKIKIGNNTNSIVGSIALMDDKKDRIRPPKKRLTATTITMMPSVEDLKRESMKFRKKVVKDLKVKHKKKDRSEKKKKKKLRPEVQITANQGENPTKIIIRFGKKSDVSGDFDKRTTGSDNSSGGGATTMTIINSDTSSKSDSKKGDDISNSSSSSLAPPKLTPIKLKLSRCQEGSYVMKQDTTTTTAGAATEDKKTAQPGQPPPSPRDPLALETTSTNTTTTETAASNNAAASSSSINSNTTSLLEKDCEVR